MTMSKLRTTTLKSDGRGGKNNKRNQPSSKGNSDKGRGPGGQSNKDSNSAGSQKSQTPGDLSRRGPAPSVTQNRHSNLFRPGSDVVKNKRCYNSDELGHLAKDCPKPRKPRKQRPRWRDRVQSLVSELYSSKPPDDQTAVLEHWQNTVGAFLS